MASGRFVLGRDVYCEFDYWPLALSMSPTKVCLQCKVAVSVRRKTCERCDHDATVAKLVCPLTTFQGQEL